MFRPALFLACLLAVVVDTARALPVPPRPSASGIVPVTWSDFNPQRPFARAARPTRLRIVEDEEQSPASKHTPSAFAAATAAPAAPLAASPAAFASSHPPFGIEDEDSLFSDALLSSGIEASLAAVLASKQHDSLEPYREREPTVKEQRWRERAQEKQAAAAARRAQAAVALQEGPAAGDKALPTVSSEIAEASSSAPSA